MNYIEKYLFKRALKKQVKKLSSPDCNKGTLCQSYSWLMRLAKAHQDDPKALSDIFNALNICLENPKNDKETYKSALFSAQETLNKEPKLAIHTADFYKKISKNYGEAPLALSLDGFVKNNPHATPVIIDCIKNVYDNNLASNQFSDRSVALLRDVVEANHSTSSNLNALEGMLLVAENKKDDKSDGLDNVLHQTMYNLDILIHKNHLNTPKEALTAMEIIKVGLNSKHEDSFITATQALSKFIDKHPDMAKEVLDTMQAGFKQNMTSYQASSSMNMTSEILQKIGKADSSLAQKVTEMEMKIHPQCPKFKFQTVNGEMLLTNFSYYPDGSLRGEMNFKDGKLHGPWRVKTKEGTLLSEESYKNGVKDGLQVKYGSNNVVIGLLVYNNGNMTNTCVSLDDAPINKLNNGAFLQKGDKDAVCFYPDGTGIHLNANNNTVTLSEKNGASRQFSGKTALNILQHLNTFDNNENKVTALHKSCKNLLQSSTNTQSKTM